MIAPSVWTELTVVYFEPDVQLKRCQWRAQSAKRALTGTHAPAPILVNATAPISNRTGTTGEASPPATVSAEQAAAELTHIAKHVIGQVNATTRCVAMVDRNMAAAATATTTVSDSQNPEPYLTTVYNARKSGPHSSHTGHAMPRNTFLAVLALETMPTFPRVRAGRPPAFAGSSRFHQGLF